MREVGNLRGKRILIVEDNPILAYSVECVMEMCGAVAIGPALNLAAAIDLAERHRLDGALLDINLGEDRVWPLAHILLNSGVPLIFLSGNCRDEDFPEAFHACACLDKPTTDAEIIRTMDLQFA